MKSYWVLRFTAFTEDERKYISADIDLTLLGFVASLMKSSQGLSSFVLAELKPYQELCDNRGIKVTWDLKNVELVEVKK